MTEVPNLDRSPAVMGIFLGLIGAIIFFAFALFDQPDRGKVAMFSYVAIAGSAATCWDQRNGFWFWFVELMAIITHFYLVFNVDYFDKFHHSYDYWFIVIIDFIVVTSIIKLGGRLFK